MTETPAITVSLVLISHSAALADGLRELACQMSTGVQIVAAGGGPAGELGTSFDRVEAAMSQAAADGRNVVVLADLGSAVLTAETVLELLDQELTTRIRLVNAPLVEGAVAAGVEAACGGSVEQVAAAAERAGRAFGDGDTEARTVQQRTTGAESVAMGQITGRVTVRNRLGLHARPAAELSRMMAGIDASVRVNGVNAASVLDLMQLSVIQGDVLSVSAVGPQARAAVDAFIGLVDGGFGES